MRTAFKNEAYLDNIKPCNRMLGSALQMPKLPVRLVGNAVEEPRDANNQLLLPPLA